MSPDLTVVVPAYNAGKFLARTLAFVAAQTVQPAEIIVADDGSTDDTVAVASSFATSHHGCAVRVLAGTHGGPGAARNAGVRAARTSWVAFLDADDLWEPEKLAVSLATIAKHPDANVLCHNETIRFLDGTVGLVDTAKAYRPKAPLPRQLFHRNLFSTSAVVCRRELVLNAGGFDEGLSSSQDYDLWLKMSPFVVPVFIAEPLGHYIVRSGNISTSNFWRRLVNLWRVKYRHRANVRRSTFVLSMVYVTVMHLAAPLRGALKRVSRRSARVS